MKMTQNFEHYHWVVGRLCGMGVLSFHQSILKHVTDERWVDFLKKARLNLNCPTQDDAKLTPV